ncbi:MAG: LysM peptidoglycan-binding domain-containing protein [Anaerolineales bacterium]|nr:LysM peptidoglycan-binding domain-containing protein [Anaerolineales bacterium]
MKIKHLILMIVLVAAMGLAACTRSASEAPTQVPGTDATQATTDQQPPSNMETAVAGGGFATQTAQAAVTTPGEPSTGETPAGDPATGTDATPVPEGAEPTVAPGTGEDTGTGQEPTAVPPTAPAEPTAASGGSCTSPYTVLAGEWIWSIGRKCNISPQAIIDANNLACYYDLAGRLQCPLYAGDTLVLPANAAPFTGP